MNNNWNKTTHNFGNMVGEKQYKTEFEYTGDLAIKSMSAGCGSCTILKVINKDPYTIEVVYTPRVLSRAELREENTYYDTVKTIMINYVDDSVTELRFEGRVYDKEVISE